MRMTRQHGKGILGRLNAHLFKHGQYVKLPSHSILFLPPDPHFFGYLVGHEPHITRAIDDLVIPGDTCIDVGANIGYFSIMMASKCGPTGHVIAYEPDLTNFKMLNINADLARRKGLKLDTVRAAASSRHRLLELVNGRHSTLHQVREPCGAIDESRLVDGINLSDDLTDRGVGKVKLLKIDVEGHEPEVLAGCFDLFARGMVQFAIIEVNAGEHANQIARILNIVGASAQSWLDEKWQSIQIAEIPHRTDILVRLPPMELRVG
jgi:FkbM family methyltransferase